MLDPQRADLTLGIVGSGLMGRGIAQIAAQGGVHVRLNDARPGAAAEAREAIAQTLTRLAEKGKLSTDAVDAALARITVADELAALAGCHVVVEAIVERLDAKQALFKALEALVGDDCLLATNTSSLSVTAIAAGCRVPERVGGFHFFSPVPLMKVVEVIAGAVTADWVGDALTALARRMGHTPVRAQDTPGFIVNHAGRGYGTEALRLLGEGVAPVADIDRVLKGAGGFRMGPFELLDLTGLDVSHPVMESIYDQYYQEPRFRPSPITRQRLAAGLLGRKSGRGFYAYDGAAAAQPVPAPNARPVRVWVSGQAPDRAALEALVTRLGGTIDGGDTPAADALLLVAPVGVDATTAAVAEGLDATRVVAIDPFFLSGCRTLMTTPVTAAAHRDAAHGLFASDGVPVVVIHDSPGFIVQRVVATLVNIACDIAQQGVTTPGDLELAVRLGLGYPQGPLAMGDALGGKTILAILDGLLATTGDPRYRASLWLRRRALLGVSLATVES